MAKLNKKPQEDHSNDWLSTYSDMVTLLLTFFVMLYATSSPDQQKWQFIYQAFKSHGKFINEYVDSPNPTMDEGDGTISEDPAANGGQGNLPQSFDQLYRYISEYVTENNLEESVSLENGVAHLSIRFDNNVFFEPNSAVLTQAGKDLLSGLAPGIRAVKSSIRRCTISGHTAKAISDVNDWDLSSGRADSVVKYMDFTKVLDSEQFRALGCAYAEPIADNDTEEGRSKNRRVEMVLLRNDLDLRDPEVMNDILKYDYGINMDDYDPNGEREEIEKIPNDYAQSIIESLDEKYPDSGGLGGFALGPAIPADYASFTVSAEAEAQAEDNSGE